MDTTDSVKSELFYDEEAFKSKVPYPLIPTNMKGVYATPPPPEDLSAASADDLVRYGLLWPGPVVAQDPTVLQAWRRLYSRRWLAKNRIIPQFGEPQVGKTHLFPGRRPSRQIQDGSYLDNDWAGIALAHAGSTWLGNDGTWIVPAVSQPSEPPGENGTWLSSSWVGIDGYGSTGTEVLQAGVQQLVEPSQQVGGQSTAYYSLWYEWYAPYQSNSPGYIYQTPILNMPVSSGDEIYCMVAYVNHAAGAINLGNATTGKHFLMTIAPPPGVTMAGNSIEWIMEAPSGGFPITSLPKFTPVNFIFARGWGYRMFESGHRGFAPLQFSLDTSGYPINGDTLNIESVSGQVLTSVSAKVESLTIDFIG